MRLITSDGAICDVAAGRVALCAMAVVAVFVAPSVCAAQAEKDVTAERCGVDFNKPAQRVFADATGKGPWTEFRDIRNLPDVNLDDGGAVVRLWPGSDGNVLVFVEEPGEDFEIRSEYCFDKDGVLSQMRFQVRTAWGWGFREEGAVKDRAVVAETKEFFDTEKNTSIAKPEAANDIPEVLKPKVYAKTSDLPFAKLLEPPKTQ
jgi:hypothetical protein